MDEKEKDPGVLSLEDHADRRLAKATNLLFVGHWKAAKEILDELPPISKLSAESKEGFVAAIKGCMYQALKDEEGLQEAFRLYTQYFGMIDLDPMISRAFSELMKESVGLDGNPKNPQGQVMALHISILFSAVIDFSFLYAQFSRYLTRFIFGAMMQKTPLGRYHYKALAEGVRAELKEMVREMDKKPRKPIVEIFEEFEKGDPGEDSQDE